MRRSGADVCFVEAPDVGRGAQPESREVPAPQLANMLSGGATPIVPMSELEAMGYKIAVFPIETLLVCGAAIRRLVEAALRDGRVDPRQEMLSFGDVKKVLGLDEIIRCDWRSLARRAARALPRGDLDAAADSNGCRRREEASLARRANDRAP